MGLELFLIEEEEQRPCRLRLLKCQVGLSDNLTRDVEVDIEEGVEVGEVTKEIVIKEVGDIKVEVVIKETTKEAIKEIIKVVDIKEIAKVVEGAIKETTKVMVDIKVGDKREVGEVAEFKELDGVVMGEEGIGEKEVVTAEEEEIEDKDTEMLNFLLNKFRSWI